ncbi:MAG: hypothetical protein JWR27_2435 [Aeromicrobium sp.]|nr:hypothetical protein [Aeromicrobium sp.]
MPHAVASRPADVAVVERAVRSASSARRRHRPWYRRITRDRVLLGLLGVLVLLLMVFGFQAWRATQSLRLAANQAELLQNQVVAGDDAGARSTLLGLRGSTQRARAMTDGMLWDVGASMPLLGRNIAAVQTVAQVADQVTTEALPPVVTLAKQINLKTFSPQDGKVDLAAVRRIAPSLEAADRALSAADRSLDAIDADSLLVPLRGPVGDVQTKIGGAADATASSELASRLLPSMLGGQGTRRYLLLIQNNAEVRASGGIPGSFAIITARDGRLSMGKQGGYVDLPQLSGPAVPMTDDEATTFPTSLVKDIRDVNVTPDFPRTGQIARAIAKKGLDTDVDGVISVDPVAMSYLLGGTGPVSLGQGVVLDQATAVDTLLSRAYLLLEPAQQDEVFKIAARAIFDAVKAGKGDARLVISGLAQAAAENRLTVWSAKDAEQREIATTGLSGELAGDDGRTPHVGVYLGDAASTKMEYYLDQTTTATSQRCLTGDVQEIVTSTTLRSNAPDNAAKLPASVTGDGRYTPRGTMRLLVRLIAPYGGGFTEVKLDGRTQTVYADSLKGRNVTKVLLTLEPGQTHTITTSMISGKGQDRPAVLSTTPGVQLTRNDVAVASACS